ncbi:MAG TPA: type II secretion system F family protein, partial [Burkholderiaceae bacterium]
VPTAKTGSKSLNITIWSSRIFNATGLAIWTRQVAGLVSSGLPLERALTALSEETTDERQRNLVASLRSEVNSGSSFARALGQHPREFSEIYTAVIGAGEQSGNLGLVLERLADDLEERQALKGKLIGAALYPAIVTLIAIVIVMFLVGYVVPQVATVFAGSKRALPLLTVIMLGISDVVKIHGWVALLFLVLAGIAGRIALSNSAIRLRFDAFWLRLPMIGTLSRGYNAARFTSTLAMLAAAGVPILKALQAAAETLGNTAMRADAMDALVLVREGAPLASAMAQKKRFPGLVSMFARLGEQTGQLPTMLQRAAKQLSAEVQRRAFALATILEPVLIVVMGMVVMLIVLAVLLPIIELNQLAR